MFHHPDRYSPTPRDACVLIGSAIFPADWAPDWWTCAELPSSGLALATPSVVVYTYSSEIRKYFILTLLPAATKLWPRLCFTRVCDSVQRGGTCMAGGHAWKGGHAWWGACMAGGTCMVGGMHGRGYVVGACLAEEHAWQGGA